MYVSMEPCGIVWFDTPTEMKQIHEDTDHMKVMNYARTPKLCFLRDRVYLQDNYSFRSIVTAHDAATLIVNESHWSMRGCSDTPLIMQHCDVTAIRCSDWLKMLQNTPFLLMFEASSCLI